MSLLWQLELNGIKLFTKLSSTEVECNACNPKKKIKLPSRSTTPLHDHVSKHPEYEKQLDELKAKQELEVRKQTTLMSVFTSTGITKDDRKVINFIACTNQPLSIVDHPTAKALFGVSELKGRKYYTEIALPNVYEAVKSKIKKQLDECTTLSFTTDIWSGPNFSFISLTAHGIDSHWSRKKHVLCVREFPGSHTYDLICAIVLEMLNEWSIDLAKVHCFLRDEGGNLKKGLQASGLLHADCGAHKLNLVVKNSLEMNEAVEMVLGKCRKLVGHFNHSNLACERLKDEQKREDLPVHKLIQDVSTRWNSTLHMTERLVEQKKAVQLYLVRYNKQELDLTEDDWKLLEEMAELLRPFEEVSNLFCEDRAPISLQAGLSAMILSRLAGTQVSTTLQPVKEKMLCLLKDKFSGLERDKLHGLALFLDPRFKDSFVQDKDKFRDQINTWINKESTGAPEPEVTFEPVKKKSKVSTSLFEFHSSMVGEHQQVWPAGEVAAEMQAYRAEKCVSLADDPVNYWKEKAGLYPTLSKIAVQYLSAPATSIASEQVFSAARQIYDYCRSTLSPKNAEMLLFLNNNLPKLDYKY